MGDVVFTEFLDEAAVADLAGAWGCKSTPVLVSVIWQRQVSRSADGGPADGILRHHRSAPAIHGSNETRRL